MLKRIVLFWLVVLELFLAATAIFGAICCFPTPPTCSASGQVDPVAVAGAGK